MISGDTPKGTRVMVRLLRGNRGLLRTVTLSACRSPGVVTVADERGHPWEVPVECVHGDDGTCGFVDAVSPQALRALEQDAAAVAAESPKALAEDVLRGLKIAHEITTETQTVEEACADLVQLVRQARTERDEAQAANARLVREHSASVDRLAKGPRSGALDILGALIGDYQKWASLSNPRSFSAAIPKHVLLNQLENWRRHVENGTWEPSSTVEPRECALGLGRAPVSRAELTHEKTMAALREDIEALRRLLGLHLEGHADGKEED